MSVIDGCANVCRFAFQILLELNPQIALVDSTLLLELNQASEVKSHVIHCPLLVISQLVVESLDKKSMSLAQFPEALLLSHRYEFLVS